MRKYRILLVNLNEVNLRHIKELLQEDYLLELEESRLVIFQNIKKCEPDVLIMESSRLVQLENAERKAIFEYCKNCYIPLILLEEKNAKAYEEELAESQIAEWVSTDIDRESLKRCIEILMALAKQKEKYDYKIQETNRQMALMEKRYSMMLYMSGEYVFEYRFKEDVLLLSNDFAPIFNNQHVLEDFRKKSLTGEGSRIEAKLPFFQTIFQGPMKNRNKSTVEFKTSVITGYQEWFRAIYHVVLDEVGAPASVMGKVVNIEKEIQEKQEKLKKSQRDEMTGIYNKTYMQIDFEDYQKQEDEAVMDAFCMLDMDNFKVINDVFGKNYGDKVIRDAAEKLSQSFRTTDVVARYESDTFLIFMKKVGSKELVLRKLDEVRKQLMGTYENNGVDINVTASMGVYIGSIKEKNYPELIELTKYALAQAKAQGKNRIEECR